MGEEAKEKCIHPMCGPNRTLTGGERGEGEEYALSIQCFLAGSVR
jgi:hypothetical protein